MGTEFYSTGSTNWKAGKFGQGLKWGYWRKGHVWSTDDLSRGGTVPIYFGRAWWFMIHKNICNGVPRQRGQRGLGLAELAGGYTPRADMYCNLKHTDCKDLIWTNQLATCCLGLAFRFSKSKVSRALLTGRTSAPLSAISLAWPIAKCFPTRFSLSL